MVVALPKLSPLLFEACLHVILVVFSRGQLPQQREASECPPGGALLGMLQIIISSRDWVSELYDYHVTRAGSLL